MSSIKVDQDFGTIFLTSRIESPAIDMIWISIIILQYVQIWFIT